MAAFDMDPVVAIAPDLVRAEPAAVPGTVRLVRHHPLREQALEGLGHADFAQPLQRPGPETRIKQVQDRMLDPADILRHRKPSLGLGAIERPVRWLACEANEIPG